MSAITQPLFAQLNSAVPQQAVTAINSFTRQCMSEDGIFAILSNPRLRHVWLANERWWLRTDPLVSPRERWRQQQRDCRWLAKHRDYEERRMQMHAPLADQAQDFVNWLFGVLLECERTYGFGITDPMPVQRRGSCDPVDPEAL